MWHQQSYIVITPLHLFRLQRQVIITNQVSNHMPMNDVGHRQYEVRHGDAAGCDPDAANTVTSVKMVLIVTAHYSHPAGRLSGTNKRERIDHCVHHILAGMCSHGAMTVSEVANKWDNVHSSRPRTASAAGMWGGEKCPGYALLLVTEAMTSALCCADNVLLLLLLTDSPSWSSHTASQGL